MVGRAGCTRTRSAGLPVAVSFSEVFHRITSALDEAGIAYMLAGSFASAYYGAPRTTLGIDFVIPAPRINCEHSSNFSRGISTMWTWMRRSKLASRAGRLT
jgi:hypothetical protein